jgi:hypothetical protein
MVFGHLYEVFGLQTRQDGHRIRERRARVLRELEHDLVISRPGAVDGDERQNIF